MIFKGIELCCPRCKGNLEEETGFAHHYDCVVCGQTYPVVAGIPDLRVFSDPYIDMESDRAKGVRLAERFDDFDFEGLVDFYYSITPAVPPKQAQLFKQGLRASVDRARASLASWEEHLAHGVSSAATLLEIGCGTAPMLVAAAPHYNQLVGIDIAFRWLVIARKRLDENGFDLPLICACAEALPFHDDSFNRIIADSVIEHLRDQRQALEECFRVMTPGGGLFVSTPNRFSLGPDPHAGLWAGSLLPEKWVAAYVRRQGGVPPVRHLLSARSLDHLIHRTGFQRPTVYLADVSAEQRLHFTPMMRRMIDLYQTLKRLPISRQFLRLFGPLLQAVSNKPTMAPSTRSEQPLRSTGALINREYQA